MVPSDSPRAPRFAIPITVLYRAAGRPRWCEGCTENISRSGVLLRVDEPIDPDTFLEMLIRMPLEVAGEGAGLSMCRARAVRAVVPGGTDPRPAIAAAIVDCERLPDDPRRI